MVKLLAADWQDGVSITSSPFIINNNTSCSPGYKLDHPFWLVIFGLRARGYINRKHGVMVAHDILSVVVKVQSLVFPENLWCNGST